MKSARRENVTHSFYKTEAKRLMMNSEKFKWRHNLILFSLLMDESARKLLVLSSTFVTCAKLASSRLEARSLSFQINSVGEKWELEDEDKDARYSKSGFKFSSFRQPEKKDRRSIVQCKCVHHRPPNLFKEAQRDQCKQIRLALLVLCFDWWCQFQHKAFLHSGRTMTTTTTTMRAKIPFHIWKYIKP